MYYIQSDDIPESQKSPFVKSVKFDEAVAKYNDNDNNDDNDDNADDGDDSDDNDIMLKPKVLLNTTIITITLIFMIHFWTRMMIINI